MPQLASGRITRYLVVAAVTVLLPALSACAASYGAVTQEPYNASNGVRADAGKLELRSVLAVAETSGSATLVSSIINNGGRDTLVGIDVRGGRAALHPAPLPLPGHVLTSIGAPGEPPAVTLTGKAVQVGMTVHLTFHFRRSPSVSMDALVMPHEGAYTDIPVPPATQP